LSGRVIEVGAGNGLNFVHYPATVTEVIAVEPEPHLRSIAEAATPWRGRVQQALDVAIWPLLVGGCHCGRDTRAAIERAGFTIDRIDVLTSAETQMTFPAAPQILGTASRR
jgi:hypothetical protein